MNQVTISALDKLPPQNLDAEQSVLGCLMLDKDGIIKVADILISEDFYDGRHKVIYNAILDLFERTISIDILTVSNLLEEQKLMDKAGGAAYITSLVNAVPTAAHVAHYANIVRKKGTLRRLIDSATEITRVAYKEDGEIEDILDKAEQRLFSVSQKHLKQNFIAINTILHETFERIDELHRDGSTMRGVPTGFLDLDKLLSGLQKSNLVILAARPSMGKTSLALDIIRYIGVDQKKPVGMFSLEMSKDELVDRLLSSQSGVDLFKIRTGHLSEDDFSLLGEAMGALSEAPIYIDDASGANIMEVRTKARRLQSEHGISLLVIDYLQLMQGRGTGNSDNRVQEVSEISRNLKILARELNVPVLVLSQLNRGVESRPDKVPQLSDLRESGSIEQDADVVMFIYREDMYKGRDSRKPNIAEVHVKKHRNGPVGQVELFFDAEKASFKNLSKTYDMSPQAVMQTLDVSNEAT